MDEENKAQLNNENKSVNETPENPVTQDNQKVFDEIMDGFYDLTRIYSDYNATVKDAELRESRKKENDLVMQGIREDIERRYNQQYEQALSNHENMVAGITQEETVPDEEPREVDISAELLTLESLIEDPGEKKDEEAEKEKEKKKKKNKRKAEEPAEIFEINEKSSFYVTVYTFGDYITAFFGKIFGIILNVILFPFRQIHKYFTLLTKDVRRGSEKRIKAILRESVIFRTEIKSARKSLRKCMRHPASIPAVIKHYTAKAFARHTPLLKVFGNILAPVAAACIMAFVFGIWNSVTFALEVKYNGESIGYINDESVYIDARDMVKNRLDPAGTNSTSSYDADVSLAIVSLEKINDAETISDRMIQNSVENLTNACGVYIDGEFICAVKNESDAKTVFYDILEPYEVTAEEEGYVVSFAEDIDYVQGLYPDEEAVVWDATKLAQLVKGENGATKVYVLQENDTLGSIAAANFSTEKEIQSLNPEYDWSSLRIGDRINVPLNVNLVNIRKTFTSSKVREIKFDTVKMRDATKYSGYRLVRQEGKNGTERVTTTITYINDELADTSYSYETLVEPVDEIVTVGTMTSRNGVYIGTASSKGFLWPAPHCHVISSLYGWRSSGWHKGVDLCTSNGTAYGSAVIASKAGRVEAVQRSSSGYGYMVLVNHGDGYKTRYAHMVAGSITVYVGEYVDAGQVLGKVGSTGNSSGPHLHFEVIYNGETKNPMNYIG